VLILKSLIAWLIILCLAVANGALREAVLIPALGRASGLVLSGILLSLVVLLVAYGFVRAVRGFAVSEGVLIGFVWLCLTLAFEFTFGLYVEGKPLSELLEAYKFAGGNVWPVVLVVTLLAPALAAALHARSKQPERDA
jgi:hypothetical protein